MKNYTAANIRNIGVFGHGGEGKTTLTEAMLFNAGLLERLGKVENGKLFSTLFGNIRCLIINPFCIIPSSFKRGTPTCSYISFIAFVAVSK